MTPEDTPPQSHGHVQEHIALIAKHEQEFLERRTSSEKLGDKMATVIGTLTFVAVHIVLFAGWIVWNTLPPGTVPRFDPFPFPLLDTVFAFEAILIASLILMRQSRTSRRAEERDHLMLQILLLSEREITAVLAMERGIAQHMGLQELAKDEKITELSQQTSIDEVAQSINETLPTE